jgi:hypothetical protein
MYYILNFYTIIFLNFIVKKINFKIMQYEMMLLIEREKTDADEL